MNGVPKTCVEKSLFAPLSRHGAIVSRDLADSDVTTGASGVQLDSRRTRAGAVG